MRIRAYDEQNIVPLVFGGTDQEVPPAQSDQDLADLVLAYQANRDVVRMVMRDGHVLVIDVDPGAGGSHPACRCYRCGVLLTVHTVRPDTRIEGVTRPVCGPCSERGE